MPKEHVKRKRPRGRPFPKGPENPRHLRSKGSDPNYDYKKDPNSLRCLAEALEAEQAEFMSETGLDPHSATFNQYDLINWRYNRRAKST
jgi:hypothetical protein